MKFGIRFHTPFRIATGHAGDGGDAVIDPSLVLPGSSLKGVMRAAARDLLLLPGVWVKRVFGTAHDPSPWAWSDAQPDTEPEIRSRARIQIDPSTGAAVSGALAVGEEVLLASATFDVDRCGWIAAADVTVHTQILTAAACAVTAVGAGRRRGLGWVSIRPHGSDLSGDEVARLVNDLAALSGRVPS